MRHHFQKLLIIMTAMLTVACNGTDPDHEGARAMLADGWQIAPAASTSATGAVISTPAFDGDSWTTASVPTTVMAALVTSGTIDDPYYDRRLERIPTEQFEGAWWYRKSFEIEHVTEAAQLVFEGTNYSADVWLNGELLTSRDDLAGAFRMFRFDVSSRLVEGTNVLAVNVHPPQPGDPTIGFVDWNPTPPDRNMGIWRPVRLHQTRGVALDRVFVSSDLDLETLADAVVTIEMTLRNDTDQAVEAIVSASISDDIEVKASSSLAPREERRIRLTAEEFPQLAISNPRLWWPNGMGEPELYGLALDVSVDGLVSDREEISFGIRHVADYVTDDGHRGYAINGRRFLMRGGGWVDDMLLMEDPQKIEDQLRYVLHMNLNTIRLEGFWGNTSALYDLADRLGIMIMVGWSCQWEWENYLGSPADEFGGIKEPEQMQLVARSLGDQVRWLRNHPSVVVWVMASDMLPRPELERQYEEQLADADPTRPALTACSTRVSEVSGPTGVKMNGPYDWVSPNYWYLDTERGGAYGFNTETGPGPQPPPAASMRRMLPEAHWWPRDDMWDYHSGRNEFNNINRYAEALAQRYGETSSLDEFAQLAQVANYEGMRAMFEAFAIRRPATTGLIQWMLNSAWPEMYWQLYDYYLVPNGAFYGARDGSRPVNIAFDYANRDVVVVNETEQQLDGVSARLRVYDLESQLLLDKEEVLDVAAESVLKALSVPPIDETVGNAYFVDLRLLSPDDEQLAASLYWLSTKPDVLDWDASQWFVTPMAEFADLTGLQSLAPADIEVEHTITQVDDGYRIGATLRNPGERIAFFIELSATDAATGLLAAPVIWTDNYVSLLPGETRTISGEIPSHASGGEPPVFHYSGINVEEN